MPVNSDDKELTMECNPSSATELATVRRIDGPTAVELLGEQVRIAIQRGELVPGQVLPLRPLAARHAVRFTTLAMVLGRAEQEGLLKLRGDTAIVAPLDAEELTGMFGLARLSSTHLVCAAARLISPTELDRAESAIPTAAGLSRFDRDIVVRGFASTRSLIRPALTAFDRGLFQKITTSMRRYFNLAERQAGQHAAGQLVARYVAQKHELIDRVRAGREPAITEFIAAFFDEREEFARASLELSRRRGVANPPATVIPLRKPAR